MNYFVNPERWKSISALALAIFLGTFFAGACIKLWIEYDARLAIEKAQKEIQVEKERREKEWQKERRELQDRREFLARKARKETEARKQRLAIKTIASLWLYSCDKSGYQVGSHNKPFQF